MNVPKQRIGRGGVITAFVALLGLVAMVAAFVANASPYGTFSDAQRTQSNSIHVAGELVPGSFHNDARNGLIRFSMKDDNGSVMNVVYTGTPPQDTTNIKRLVAIGGVKNGVFESNKLIIKCPSRYESGNAGDKSETR